MMSTYKKAVQIKPTIAPIGQIEVFLLLFGSDVVIDKVVTAGNELPQGTLDVTYLVTTLGNHSTGRTLRGSSNSKRKGERFRKRKYQSTRKAK